MRKFRKQKTENRNGITIHCLDGLIHLTGSWTLLLNRFSKSFPVKVSIGAHEVATVAVFETSDQMQTFLADFTAAIESGQGVFNVIEYMKEKGWKEPTG